MQPTSLPIQNEDERVERLRSLVRPHVESFDWAMMDGLGELPSELDDVCVAVIREHDAKGQRQLRVSLENAYISKPRIMTTGKRARDRASSSTAAMYPRHAREGRATYQAELNGVFCFREGDTVIDRVTRRLGEVPVMVCSSFCNLHGLSPAELIDRGEEEYELGGYFICNGVEKVVRMVVVPRRNHMIALRRPSNANRGPLFTDFALSMRCVRSDQCGVTNHLHYLMNGSMTVRFSIRRQEFFLPIVLLLQALLPRSYSDREMFDLMVQARRDDAFLCDRVIAMIKDVASIHIRLDSSVGGNSRRNTPEQVVRYLGSTFKVALDPDDTMTFGEVGQLLLRKYILVHLSESSHNLQQRSSVYSAKVDLFLVMIWKLISVVRGERVPDNPDSLANQEVLLPGHLYLMYMKEKIEDCLRNIKLVYQVALKNEESRAQIEQQLFNKDAIEAMLMKIKFDVGRRMELFIATGNLQTQSGLGLLQTSGYSVVADRINYLRFMAHFRSIHRGKFFAEVKTTSVRRLLPESWGFICPVHTPDGAPCGLLNHITSLATVSQKLEARFESIADFCFARGAQPPPAMTGNAELIPAKSVPILMDGRVLGYVLSSMALKLSELLRIEKVKDGGILPPTAEVVHVEDFPRLGIHPGVFLYSGPARLLRPVKFLRILGKDDGLSEEMIGSFEQVR